MEKKRNGCREKMRIWTASKVPNHGDSSRNLNSRLLPPLIASMRKIMNHLELQDCVRYRRGALPYFFVFSYIPFPAVIAAAFSPPHFLFFSSLQKRSTHYFHSRFSWLLPARSARRNKTIGKKDALQKKDKWIHHDEYKKCRERDKNRKREYKGWVQR